MQREPGHLLNEADIGSGEKPPGQRDTEQEIRKVDNPKMDDATEGKSEKEKESSEKSRDRSPGKK